MGALILLNAGELNPACLVLLRFASCSGSRCHSGTHASETQVIGLASLALSLSSVLKNGIRWWRGLGTWRQTRSAWHLPCRRCDFELLGAVTDAEVSWLAWASASPSVKWRQWSPWYISHPYTLYFVVRILFSLPE